MKLQGYRAPDVPGFGIRGTRLASLTLQAFILAAGYELPFGKGKRFMPAASGLPNKLWAGGAPVWSATLQGRGQPITP